MTWGALPVGSLFVAATAFFFTTIIVPAFNLRLTNIPILRWIVRRWIIRFWLIDDDRREPLPPSEDWQLWKIVMRRIFPEIKLNPLPDGYYMVS